MTERVGCGLTDDELRVHLDNHRKIAEFLGTSPMVSATCSGIAAALEELLARRAIDSYVRASESVRSKLVAVECDATGEGIWFDSRFVCEGTDQVPVARAMLYLESRGLLARHPDNPAWVRVLNESEVARG